MMTEQEARQRLAFNRFTMSRAGVNYVIHPVEGCKRAGFQDYFSDDLEDVVLKAGSLRRRAA